MLPDSVAGVVVALLLLVPGIVLSGVRGRLRGPTRIDSNVSARILRAITISFFLDGLYLAATGNTVADKLRRLGDGSHRPLGGGDVRVLAVEMLVLLFVVPCTLAVLSTFPTPKVLARPSAAATGLISRLSKGYDPRPSAWEELLNQAGYCFVRIRRADGSYLGGWMAKGFMSTFPDPHDLFLESEWRFGADGSFEARVEQTRGLFVTIQDGDSVALLDPPPATGG